MNKKIWIRTHYKHSQDLETIVNNALKIRKTAAVNQIILIDKTINLCCYYVAFGYKKKTFSEKKDTRTQDSFKGESNRIYYLE